MEAGFRTGDVLRLSCPFTPASVTGTSRFFVSVRWPWVAGRPGDRMGRFDPPLVTGRLPRPRTHVVVLREGQSYDPTCDEQGYEIDPDDDIPIRLDLVFRPYPFLDIGDELADSDGRAWRFDGPWDWYAFDARTQAEPTRLQVPELA